MKALVWEAPRVLALREQPDPEPAAGEALIRVAYAGICGSELGGYLGHNALRRPPLIMGHEFAGEIAALGPGAADWNPELRVGRPVTANPLVYCGECFHCRRGLNQLCLKRQLIGAHRPGAFAEFVRVPIELVTPLPEGLSARSGALAEPAAVAVRLGEMAGPVAEETALVIGAGPIGLLALQVLCAQGAAQVFIADLDPARLKMAAALGGQALDPRAVDVVEAVREATGGAGAPVAIDAVGAAVTRRQCVSAARASGTVLLSGLHEEASEMPAADIIRREVVVRGSFAYSPRNFADALDRLARGTLSLEPWVVTAPLEDGGPWFDRLIEAPGDVAKVLLVPRYP